MLVVPSTARQPSCPVAMLLELASGTLCWLQMLLSFHKPSKGNLHMYLCLIWGSVVEESVCTGYGGNVCIYEHLCIDWDEVIDVLLFFKMDIIVDDKLLAVDILFMLLWLNSVSFRLLTSKLSVNQDPLCTFPKPAFSFLEPANQKCLQIYSRPFLW